VAKKSGILADDSQIQRVVQFLGKRALEQEERRVSRAFDSRGNKEVIREAELELKGAGSFSMVLMLDGTMLRFRGVDWGMKPATQPGDRAPWNELKAGLVIRIPKSESGKRCELEKWYVASEGGPEAIGRKLYAEALRRGLEQAERVYVIADGAVWIWKLVEEHFPESVGELDFYHAAEHLWTLGKTLCGDGEEEKEKVREWVRPLLTTLKYRGGKDFLSMLEGLAEAEAEKNLTKAQRHVLNREVAYFRNHESRLDYPKAKSLGIPLGSGSM
jgi:hypothetical protein